MKLLLIAGLFLQTTAHASEPINCLQWRLQTEKQYVSSRQANQAMSNILTQGIPFGFVQESKQSQGQTTDYYFRYNRAHVISRPQVKRMYGEFTKNLEWHLNSRLGYRFECSFEATGPRPRISGSN